MGAKQNFNLGGINSHFNGLKDAGNMSPTQLALTYSKEQLQHMAQMGVINPTNAVIAGMNIDRISNTNAPPTSTISQDTFAPQQPQQGQLPQRSADPSNFSKQFSADALNPPLPKGNAQGGIMSIPRPGQKYQQGGVVAFSNRGEVKAPIYDEDAEFEQYKDKHQRARGRNYGERPLFDSNSKAGLMANPEIEQNSMVWKGLTPKERLDMAQRDIQFNKDHPDSARLNSLIGKEPAGVGALAAQSARSGAGAGAPPAQLAQPNPDYEAFMKTLKNPNLSSVYKDIPDEKDNDLNRALIRGGAAMMANRDPAIGSGLQGFLQTAGKGATEGLTGYEQSREKSKKRSDDLQKNRAEEASRNEGLRLSAAGHGATAILQKQAEENKIPAAALLAQNEEKRARIAASGNMSLVEAWDRAKTPEEQAKIMRLVAGMHPRTATGRDFSRAERGKAKDAWLDKGMYLPQYAKLKGDALAQAEEGFVQNYLYQQYGDGGGGGGGNIKFLGFDK